VYGEKAPELYEPLFYYGKTLLELARCEQPVIGNAIKGGKVQDGSLYARSCFVVEDIPEEDSNVEDESAVGTDTGDAKIVGDKLSGWRSCICLDKN
jgi:hypothetical protein